MGKLGKTFCCKLSWANDAQSCVGVLGTDFSSESAGGLFYPRYCIEVLMSIKCGAEWMCLQITVLAPILVVGLNF